MNSFVGYYIIGLLVGLLLFFICRELFCWYWKINEIRDLLKSIDKRLSEISGFSQANAIEEGKIGESKENKIANCSQNNFNEEKNKEISDVSKPEVAQVDIFKIDEVHYNKLLERTNDRALIVKIKDLYKKEDEYYCFVDSGLYGEETKEFIKKYITKSLGDMIRFENRK